MESFEEYNMMSLILESMIEIVSLNFEVWPVATSDLDIINNATKIIL